MIRQLITVACSVVIVMQLGAQTTISSDSLDLLSGQFEEITISENRLDIPFSDNSRSISILTKRDIAELQATSINEVLQIIAGVDIRQRGINGVQADVSIRGGTFEQTLILLNGVRLIDPQTGHHMMNVPVAVSAIERIEVIKGPAARIYGQNAFAGAINIVTKVRDKQFAQFSGEYGQHDLASIFSNVSLPVGDYQQDLNIAYNKSAGYRDNTDYEITNVFYQSQLKVGASNWGFFAGVVDRKFGANGFYGRESFTEQYEEVRTTVANLNYTTLAADWQLKSRVNYRRNKDNWQFKRSDPEFFQNFHTTDVWTAELHASRTHALGNFGFGVEANALSLDSSNLKDSLDNGQHKRQQLAFHLENRFLLLDERLDITPGVLLLSVSDYGLSAYPGLDIGYDVGKGVKLFSNVGMTSRIPTFTDLYYKDSGSVGNADLIAEQAFTAELGLKYHVPNYQLQLSLFARAAEDQIDWFRISDGDKWMPDNFNQANYKGLDISSNYRFGKESILQSFRVAYTYISATFEANDFAFSRNQLENLRHQLVISPVFSYGPVTASLLMKYNDRVSLEDYYVLDANVNWKLGYFDIFAKGRNLFDHQYRESNLVDMPGRWLSIGARVSLD